MSQQTIAIIFGGKSSEYSVSLHSAASLLNHINTDKYNVVTIGISQEGNWYLYQGDIKAIEEDTWLNKETTVPVVLSCNKQQQGFLVLKEDQSYKRLEVDCLFPVLHGKNGEDGTIQGLFELSEIPYVGCDHLSSAICMDKEMTHIICERSNIPCAPYFVIYQQDKEDYEKLYHKACEQLALPFFIKPCNAGSSYGVHKVHNLEEFIMYLQDAFYHDGRGKVIVESTIEGFEIGCAVCGNETLMVGSVDEIEIQDEFFDFQGKYEMKNSQIHCPARITSQQKELAQQYARQAFQAMNCKGLARVDLFVCKDGTLVLNEINTLPGFTATSRYPSMMKDIGIDFTSLIDQLIQLAFTAK